MERRPIAMTPANTPGPIMATSINAQINELMDLDEAMIKSATGLMRNTCGVVFRAAQKATGMAMKMAMAVPRVAMFNVSHMASQRLSM